MNRKLLWMVVSGLMALSLIVAACGTPTPPTTTPPTNGTTPPPAGGTTPPPTIEPPQGVVVPPPSVEQPKYGGTLTVSTTANPNPKGFWTYEKYLQASWEKGPAGTNEYDPIAGASGFDDNAAPGIAESWSMPQQGVWVLNIRQGVHWAQTPFPTSALMNGREVTAADVVWSFNWELGSPRSWIWVSQPQIAKASSINQTGPWQVTMLTPVDPLTSYVWLIGAGGGYAYLAPREVTEKLHKDLFIYQGEGWPYQEVVSTAPYIFSEVVASSYTKQIKNQNYWEKDPVGPGKGNQLPYIDVVKTLTIPDRSTSLAALRTGKIDLMTGFTKEEWEKEMQQTPRYKWAKSMSNTTGNRVIFMRMDKQDKPYKDIRVRKALMMATDFNAFKDQYYGGAAEIDVWPVNSNFRSNIYTPLNEMPAAVQELYSHNIDKAKALLKEAGYPNGFKATVVYSSAADGDDLSIFKDQWSKVGVELVLDVKDLSIYNTATATKNYDDMIYRFNYSNFPQDFYFTSHRGPSSNNISYYNVDFSDKVIEEAYAKTNAAMIIDMPTVYKVLKELRPYIMESATVIPRPTPYTYSIWNPWLKNYYGSQSTKYHWIDQDLKKSMGF